MNLNNSVILPILRVNMLNIIIKIWQRAGKHLTLKNRYREEQLFSRRLLIISLGVIVLTSILFFRLVYLQVFQYQRYANMSNQNQMGLIPLEPDRGLVYDRNGVILAENIPVFSLEIIPERVTSLKQILTALQNIIDIDDEDIQVFQKLQRIYRADDSIPIRLKLTEDEVALF